MKKLSLWAKKNQRKARLIIIVSHLLIILLAWFTGREISGLSDNLPGYLKIIFALVFIIALFTYPVKKSMPGYSYAKQKSCDFLLALSTFGMVTGITASGEISFGSLSPLYATSPSTINNNKKDPTAEQILASLKHRDKSTLTRAEKRILKAEFKNQLKIWTIAKISGNKEEGDKAGLLILAIIGAVGLFFLVAALSCSLACNGSDAAAIVVLLLGTAAIVLGLLAIIRSINRKKRKTVGTQVN
jgi:hypothetical protein